LIKNAQNRDCQNKETEYHSLCPSSIKPRLIPRPFGKEVDFVVEHFRRLLAFEVRLTRNPTLNDAQNLLSFPKGYPRTVRGDI
jgi:hypothetical protein